MSNFAQMSENCLALYRKQLLCAVAMVTDLLFTLNVNTYDVRSPLLGVCIWY